MYINTIVNNLSFYLLQASFLLVPLYFNKNVLRFRISQQALLYFFVILLLFLISIKFLFSRQDRLDFHYHTQPLHHKAIFLFILLLFFSFMISSNRWVSFQDFLLFLSYFAFYFMVIFNVRYKKLFYSIIHILFLTAFIVSLYTILQYYRWDPFLKEMTQLTSTIGQKNWISNYLVMIFPVVFSYFLLEQTKKNRIIYFFLLSILYATLMICQSRGIWISIVCAFLIGIFLIYKYKIFDVFKKNKKWIVLIIITFLLITIIYSTDNPLNKSYLTVPQRALSTLDEQDPSINTRLLIWKNTLQMIKDNPLWSSGIGTFRINYLNYQAKYLKDNPDFLKYYATAGEAHNEYLQIAAETGLSGLGIFIFIIFSFYRLALNFIKNRGNNFPKEINVDKNLSVENKNYPTRLLNGHLEEGQNKKESLKKGIHRHIEENKSEIFLYYENEDKDGIIIFGLLMGITCFLIHSLFCFPLHVPALGMTFFGIMGLTIAYIGTINIKKRDEQKEKTANRENNSILNNLKSLLLSVIVLSIAAICLLNFLVFRPYYAELLYFQGLRHTVDQEYDLALMKFDKAYRFNPYDGKNLHALGGTYYNLKNYEKAEELLVKAKHYLTDVNTFYNLGLIYTQTGLYKKAEEEYKQAIYLNPKFTKGYHYLGLLYFQQENYDGAIEQWNKILEIESNFPNKYIILNNLGIVYQKKEMPDKALEYFVQTLQLVPEGDPIEKEIEEEINKIYKSNLKN